MQRALSSNRAWVFNGGMGRHTRDIAHVFTKNPNRRIIMTEGVGFNEAPPQHSFVMFRNPQSHVLSQFFHCTESRAHKGQRHRMPNGLLEWLQAWESIRQNTTLEQQQSPKNAGSHWKDGRFKCYNPINYQSWMTGYPSSKKHLETMFDAIGIQSHFHLSSCVFLTTALQRVPTVCNCTLATTSLTREANMATTTSGSFMLAGADDNHNTTISNNTNHDGTQKTHNGHDHGVTHHGDVFQPSELEMQLIHNLTRHDQVLYENGLDIFRRQVADLEHRYQVEFCSSPPPGMAATSTQKRGRVRRTI